MVCGGDSLQKRRSDYGQCFSGVGVWEGLCCGAMAIIQGETAFSQHCLGTKTQGILAGGRSSAADPALWERNINFSTWEQGRLQFLCSSFDLAWVTLSNSWCFLLLSHRGCSVTCWYCLCLYPRMNRFARLDFSPAKMESQLWYVKWKGRERLLCFYCFDNKKCSTNGSINWSYRKKL